MLFLFLTGYDPFPPAYSSRANPRLSANGKRALIFSWTMEMNGRTSIASLL
jgi:hypothetical protein